MSFEFDFTADQVKELLKPNSKFAEWHSALCAVLPKYGITTKRRVAMFIAQCAHESASFTTLKENLNYRAAALTATWPKRFPAAIAVQYEKNPEKIANRAYCDRMGNGPETSGDGWKYHGRGLIQLTGKDGYLAFSKAIGKTLEETVAYCETSAGALESAAFYWKTHDLNVPSDAGDVTKVTKIINGGTIGLDDRVARYNRAMQLFGA